MLFAQSDPPLSHTEIEDSPEEALRIAIDAYGRTVGAALHAVAAGEPRQGERLTMDFGVVLQTDPPAARVIDLAKRAETYGFTHAWTFDSHLLWEEPFVIYSRILNETHKLHVGPMVTNPATRDWTVTASLFATLNEMYGNRTVCGIGRGDSAVRVINGKPVTLADAARGDRRHPRARQRRGRSSTRAARCGCPGTRIRRLPIWVAAYGPKALALAGEVGDGFILQLADPADHRVEHRGGARARPRRPAATRTR